MKVCVNVNVDFFFAFLASGVSGAEPFLSFGKNSNYIFLTEIRAKTGHQKIYKEKKFIC